MSKPMKIEGYTKMWADFDPDDDDSEFSNIHKDSKNVAYHTGDAVYAVIRVGNWYKGKIVANEEAITKLNEEAKASKQKKTEVGCY